MSIALTPNKVATSLFKLIPARMPVLLKGAPGVAKTSIVEQVVDQLGYDIIVSHPVVSDPTDAKGLPWIAKDQEHATFLPFGDLHRALTATTPTVWFLDDLGQASPAVQASFMQLLLARRVNGHVLPDCVTFVSATNRRGDRAGVSGMLEPVKSRFVTIIEVEADVESWNKWALTNLTPLGLDNTAIMVGYMKLRGAQMLSKFEPKQDIENSPSPRGWHSVAKLLSLGFDEELLHANIAGAVGEAAATDFFGFYKTARRMPDIDDIIKNPKTADIPHEMDILYAVSVALSMKVTMTNFANIATYIERMNEAQHGDVATMTLIDCCKKLPQAKTTGAFTKLATGPMKELVLGAAGI